MITQLIRDYASLCEIEAIALGGSRASHTEDQSSDYDLYIYCFEIPKEEKRREILEKYCQYMEISNQYWELEDDCTLKNGIDIDIIYRNLDHFINDVADVVEMCHERNGYTTCMWHNLIHSEILFDRNGRYKQLQDRMNVPYPKQLKENIIHRNMKLLTGNLPSYDKQILKAVSRKDLVSMNHRVSAFLESYFDIIFAMNEKTHPGEKKLIKICKEECTILPDDFEKNLEQLFKDLFLNPQAVEKDLLSILEEIKKALNEGLIC